MKAAWPSIDSSEYQDCWAIDALCEHLSAVTEGDIRRLLVNYPPRSAKTTVTSICWPAWIWARNQKGFLSGPSVRCLSASYNISLSLQNANKTRRLILSPWFQNHWGHRFKLQDDQNTKSQFDTTEGGSRIATSVGGSLIGIGGDVIVCDDLHNTQEAESEADREAVLNFWKEISSTRLNDPKQSAIVVIMQRLHEEDVSGVIASSEEYPEWTHLMIPMRHDIGRHCVTVLKPETADEPEKTWEDPRTEDGELMWPERFGEKEVSALESSLGPYMASGRLQQSPVPPGGGMFKREWWKVWEPADGKWPTFDYLVGSVDGAFTEDEENDPSAMTVWGVFKGENGVNRVMLVKAWRKFLQMHGDVTERGPNETFRQWIRKAQPKWGLVEWVAETCRFRNPDGVVIGTIDRLLIESKASGITAAQEIQRLYGNEGWMTQLVDPKGDKVARAHAIVPLFSNGLIHAPDREWADTVIDEMANFPKGTYRDLTDTASQALKHLRVLGLVQRDEDARAEEALRGAHKKKSSPLYPV